VAIHLVDMQTEEHIDVFGYYDWRDLRRLAVQYGGWKPRGTTCPPDWDEAECTGNYDAGIMAAEDSHAFADALEKALPFVLDEPDRDEEGVEVYTWRFHDRERLELLIRELRGRGEILIT